MIFAVIIAILLVPAVIVLADLAVRAADILRHRGIGRWESREEWLAAVTERARKWLVKMPVVRKDEAGSYVLTDKIKGSGKSGAVQSWQLAGLAAGLADRIGAESVKDALEALFNADGSWKDFVPRVDFAMLSWACLRYLPDSEKIRPAMDETVRLIESHLCSDGMICYVKGKDENIRFVDTLGMVCPFLALYAKKYDKPGYLSLALDQIKLFRAHGMLAGSELPCHAFDSVSKKPLGVYGWGRGTAWYALALTDTLDCAEDEDKKYLTDLILKAAEEYKTYEKDGFDTILQGGGQYDSSATAFMSFFFRKCALLGGDDSLTDAADKAERKLMGMTMKDGAVDCCQGDTHGIGCFSQTFGIMPFAQGLVLRGSALPGGKK